MKRLIGVMFVINKWIKTADIINLVVLDMKENWKDYIIVINVKNKYHKIVDIEIMGLRVLK